MECLALSIFSMQPAYEQASSTHYDPTNSSTKWTEAVYVLYGTVLYCGLGTDLVEAKQLQKALNGCLSQGRRITTCTLRSATPMTPACSTAAFCCCSFICTHLAV